MTPMHAADEPKSLQEAWEEIEAVLGPDPTNGAGAALLVVMAWRARGFPAESEHLEELSGRLGLEPQRVSEIATYCDRLVGSEAGLTLCRGLTCTLHGAEAFHARLKSLLTKLQLERPLDEVFCLSQCEHGPSVMQGDRIWVTRAQRVVEARRAWRHGDSGPVPISDNSLPNLD